MSLLKITKVSGHGDLCWGVVLFDDEGKGLLRSVKGVGKVDAARMAETLKSEGAGAPVVEIGKEESGHAAWIVEKTPQGWSVSFNLVAGTTFDLLLKPEAGAEPPKVALEAVGRVKECLVDVEIVWEPAEARPPSGPIPITIDDEPVDAPMSPMTANEILELGGLDLSTHYLVQIKDGARIKYQDKGEQPIELFAGAAFVGHFTGEKPVSEARGEWPEPCW